MSSSNSGSCLCGAVKYGLSDAPEVCYMCHCNSCQKVSGSAFTANCLYKRENLNIIQGHGVIKTYSDQATFSGQALERSFCDTCGSNLFLQSKLLGEMGMVAVPSGTIDDRTELRPKIEAWCQSRRSWLSGVEGTEQKEKQ
ncbi:hypothetical protein ASPWEDRAFT_163282 [Aspergillus wentii DTO 134E9]|uniref:CENP-V/GFA domain-containing protein n=1 Tax=Aspergillus wentii DTO 134E9 TaxID=1073089 RepID=A0A1L9R8V1_ASPWE|nr:uncharacterized protein ASPWEDRAFT_163282 [Aspergillus wentii DTO 134E9]KAI9926600.1 hypothetical protein MW887_004369 [Aspergillus wentii]OJJ31350.1 hypothetical protein ASPWEDRAFT_163282 [Aspergillus wentii DTO 134E9]